MLIDLVKSKVKDDSGRLTDDDDYLPAIAAALATYSKHNPKSLVADLAGTGGHDLDLPAGWVEDLSTIRRVEYPLDEIPANLVDPDDWIIYEAPTGLQLRLIVDTPAIGEAVRLSYTGARVEDDVPAQDLDAVACLAASYCMQTLASLFVQTSDPTIAADVVNYRTKSGEADRQAKALKRRYTDLLGIKENDTVPAAMTTARSRRSGRTRLTH